MVRRRKFARRRRRRRRQTGRGPFLRLITAGALGLAVLLQRLHVSAPPVTAASVPIVEAEVGTATFPVPPAHEPHRTHTLAWSGSSGAAHRGTVRIWQASYRSARGNRMSLGHDAATAVAWQHFHQGGKQPLGLAAPWAWAYANLHAFDRRYAELYAMYEGLREGQGKRFVELAVASVQSVPYTLIHQESCAAIASDDPNCEEYVCRYHANGFQNEYAGGRPCVPETRYGLLSPIEFLYTLQGDCDTRTLFLYTVLRRFGYDVAILLSTKYQHCVLGVHAPGRGRYVEHHGKRYYAWETVARGWQLGQLSPDQRNMQYWQVVLAADTP